MLHGQHTLANAFRTTLNAIWSDDDGKEPSDGVEYHSPGDLVRSIREMYQPFRSFAQQVPGLIHLRTTCIALVLSLE